MARFSVIPASAISDTRLSTRDLTVLCALGLHTDRNGWCFPSASRIGEILGVSRQMVQRCIGVLASAGYVEVRAYFHPNGGQGANRIRVCFDTDQPDECMRSPIDRGGTQDDAGGATTELQGGQPLEVARRIPSKDPIERIHTGTGATELQLTSDGPPAAAPKKPSPAIPRAIPDDFEVTAEMRSWAEAELPRLDVDKTTGEFCDYWRGKARNNLKRDWPATWRNWMRESDRRGQNRRATEPTHPGVSADEQHRLAERKLGGKIFTGAERDEPAELDFQDPPSPRGPSGTRTASR